MWQHYLQPATLEAALHLLAAHAGQARIVAGATDVLIELRRGVRPTTTLIDISHLHELRYVRLEGGIIRLGGLATHNDVLNAADCVGHALPLAQACLEVGAPQIRARATVAGNLVTASPANDTITPLVALGAELLLASVSGERVVPLSAFYTGVRRTVLRPDELVREIRFAALNDNQRGLFLKLGLRHAQAIAVINLAIVLTLAEDGGRKTEDGGRRMEDGESSTVFRLPSTVYPPLQSATITLGSVAPTIVRASAAEAFLAGKTLDEATCAEAGRLARDAATPIDDLRGSAAYRLATVQNLVAEGLRRLAAGHERATWPAAPVLLETVVRPMTNDHRLMDDGLRTTDDGSEQTRDNRQETTGKRGGYEQVSGLGSRVSGLGSTVHRLPSLIATINGRPAELPNTPVSLLDALRQSGLTGAKEGCAEGECGACTVWLDGRAVMACLVPAPQAAGAQIVTIEGLAATSAQPAVLHPLQQAFIEHAAVQCGFCIPGMLMAGAKLLQEHPSPDLAQIRTALSGNICRCTGYRKILDAVLAAADSDTMT